MEPWLGLVILVSLAAGYWLNMWNMRIRLKSSFQEAERILADARREAENIRTEGRLQAKAEVIRAREEFEASTQKRREEIAAAEERISQREANLDRKVALLDRKEQALEQRVQELERRTQELEQRRAELERLAQEERRKLERIAGMSREEARQALLSKMENEMRGEIGGLIRHFQEEARQTADREAQKIVAQAIQRYAAGHASELMTTTVTLPSEEMKGRIIGREGRNVRAIEAATGVTLLIDDTPEAVVISAFDPVRREIARLALERLILDGRIHPARIEEVVAKVREEMDQTIRRAGEEALYLVGIHQVDPDLVSLLGRLKFRTSYAQNVLTHSIEVAQLMGVMAGELDADVSLAKRIGLFHDIGKALDHAVEGGHAIIGADLLRRHGEPAVLVNAVGAHHEEVTPESVYAVLASAADAISGARPGARSETTELYIKRIEKLEALANAFPGVERSYAIQAGREVRVLVKPDEVDDAGAIILARNISKKIESDLQYPGQIRVVVVRETRCVEYAR